jgi:hypothetical protein
LPLSHTVAGRQQHLFVASRGDRAEIARAHRVAERVTIEPGDFFKSAPDGGDVYILSHVIHDWSEDQCLTILGHCRKAMKPAARSLIIEMVLPPGDAPHRGKMLDMAMLAMMGGQERTEAEYAAKSVRSPSGAPSS